MTYIPEYWKDKQWRARQAQKHTELMAEKYSKEIQHSVDNTVIYDGATFTPKADCKVQNESGLAIDNLDSVSAIFKHNYDENEKIAVLNFASYKNPGGMFINGSKAQEECLCHDSFLYNVLKEFTDSYYARNNLYKNKALYMDRALYSPDVVFEVDGKLRKVDVITCAAPNKSAAQKYLNVTDEENYAIFDAMGVPRTTDGVFQKGSEAPFSSDGMVTFAQAIREGKMDIKTDDFQKLTGCEPITVREMFADQANYQIGDRHSKDD